jgi:dihydroxyacetone kinase-like protein
LIVLNHAGDVLAANIAMQAAEREGLNVKMVLTEEDISSPVGDRRGLVGCVAVYKVAGAAAERGAPLGECVEIAQRMANNMRTLAVAVRSATHPATGQPIFELEDDEMEIGMGQHGEAGTGRTKLKTANETADIMLEQLLADLKVNAGEELLVILNGAGATTLMELYIVFRRLAQVLDSKGIRLVRSAIGEFITTQEQAGFQMMIARMDSELLDLWDRPADTPFFRVL